MIYGIKTEVKNGVGNMSNIRQYQAFHKCNKVAFQHDLENVPWQVLETFDDIDDRWYHWKQLFLSILDEHVPLKTVRCRWKQVPWISEETREMMKIRNHLWKKAHIQLLQTEDGEISDSQDIGETFHHFFTYRTQAVAGNPPPRQAWKDSAIPVQFTFKPVEERIVAELLSNINMRKATGCDEVSATALKLAVTTLAPSLCGLFNQSITSATLPHLVSYGCVEELVQTIKRVMKFEERDTSLLHPL